MAKKLLIIFIFFLLLAGLAGFYSALKYHDQIRQARQTAKAEDVSITFLEGWTSEEMAAYLQTNNISKAADFLSTAEAFNTADYPLLASKPKTADLEGFLFPDTYFIPKNSTFDQQEDEIIIKKALDNFSQKFTPSMEIQAKALNKSIYQIVTLASIIEKETGASQQERKIVAGIFYNRLSINMPMESDATVNFATGKKSPSASSVDTQINSPYNTYKYKGLPPGPISNPSLSSIMAALYPEKTDYMFFLHDQKTGQAYYAKTYEEQLKNKQKYLK